MAHKNDYDIYLGRIIDSNKRHIEKYNKEITLLEQERKHCSHHAVKEVLSSEIFLTQRAIKTSRDAMNEAQKILATRRRRYKKQEITVDLSDCAGTYTVAELPALLQKMQDKMDAAVAKSI
jgi:hypothetical protein